MLISEYTETASCGETKSFKNNAYFGICEDGRPALITHSKINYIVSDFYENDFTKTNKYYLTEDDVKILKEIYVGLKEMLDGDAWETHIPLSKQNLSCYKTQFIDYFQVDILLPYTDLDTEMIIFDSNETFEKFIETINEL